jgi:thiamine kinase-like enzyme
VVTLAALLDNVVERTPLRQTSQGYSGATLERVVLADGRALVIKRLSPAWDATMRLTHDTGRAAWLWASGVMDRFPPVIDHTIVAAEPTEDGWVIVMRDISDALLPDDRMLTRAESRRILEAAAALHRTFRGERIEGLCRLSDHLSLFSPRTAGSERDGASPVFEWIERGWDLFPDVVPHDVAVAIHAIHEQPDRLASELNQCATTLIHGDLWLANVGLQPDCVVILDWGTATQAPPAFEFTTYLTGAWSRIMATREELIDDVRAASGGDHDERALQLSFIATFAEYGWNKALDATEHSDAATRAREAADLAWWIDRVRRALETIWSPV